ncbi:MAG TPA: hypothetical protein VD834_16920, partial [Blastococcus sp.]|nr:hypothetical protein [Blastococcus sp.]
YSVGDVVAYHSESLDTVVMHRIVSTTADGFVTRGDNNSWLDVDRPTAEDILGELFLHVPQGGRALDAITSPWMLGLVGLASSLVMGSVRTARSTPATRSRRRRGPALRGPSLSLPTRPIPRFSVGSVPMLVRARARQVALGSGAVALVAVLGLGALVALPATETVSETVTVSQEGRFSYTGSAERGTTYPDGVVETGDTVWTKLARGLTVAYTGTVSGPELAEIQGALRLDVSVTAGDGWSTYLNSGPVVALQDGTATASVAVDDARASAVLSEHYAEVGGSGSSATLTVTPTTAVSGTVRGAPFEAAAPAGLDFTLDPTSLRLAGEADAVLEATTETPVTVDEVRPRVLEVSALTIPIGVARAAAVAVLGLALAARAGGVLIGRSGRGGVADEFVVRHADRIVPVTALSTGGTVIDVSDAESLHRVAERFDTVVLHHAGAEEDVFAVRDVDATYRFVVPGTSDRRRGRPPVPAPSRRRPAEEPPAADLTNPLSTAGSLRGLVV